MDIVRDLQLEIPDDRIVKYWIGVAGRIVQRTGTIISELETLGLDVAELKDIHSHLQEELDKAKDELAVGDIGAAGITLGDIRTHLLELKSEYLRIISAPTGGGIQQDKKEEIEKTADAVGDAAEGIEGSF